MPQSVFDIHRLENARVRLETIIRIEDHSKLLNVALSHDDLLQYSPSDIHSPALLEKYFKNALDDRYRGQKVTFLIFDKIHNSYAGSTSFGNISQQNKRLEIGWTWIGKKFQRTGTNRNTKYILLSAAFDHYGFERIEFKIDSRNTQSRMAAEAIGAKYEGNLRSHTVMSDGFRRDTVYYSILKSEWPEVKNQIFKDYEPLKGLV